MLTKFNSLGNRIDVLRKKVQFYQELAACESWTALEFAKALKQTSKGEEKVEQIMIDRKVNQMDPDFSFSTVMYDEPMPSLCNKERPK